MSEGRVGVPAQLAVYRATIDNLDAALVHLLAERFRCTQQVGLLKARLDLPPADPGRERQQVARLRALAEESGLDPIFAEKFFAFIVAEVIQHHEEIRDGHEAELARRADLAAPTDATSQERSRDAGQSGAWPSPTGRRNSP